MITKRTLIAVGLFVAACGGAEDAEPEEAAYKDMSFEQRYAFMNAVVLPQMKEVFVAFDPKFEAMSCATCHGKGQTDGTFAMPTSDLPRLPPSEEAFAEYVKDPDHAKWSQFMLEKVWPKMADLLQIPLFDPEKSPSGFSCHNCHKVEGEP